MGFFDQLGELITPHAQRLNQTIGNTGILIHAKLDAIQKATSDLGRPDIGNQWFRINVNRKFAAEEEFEIGEAPINEVWLIQSLVTDGVTSKSPTYVVLLDAASLLFAVIKEGVGEETPGGDMVAMPGETLSIKARTEGTIHCTIHVIRRKIPSIPEISQTQNLPSPERLTSSNVHDPNRDIITSKSGIYSEIPGELIKD